MPHNYAEQDEQDEHAQLIAHQGLSSSFSPHHNRSDDVGSQPQPVPSPWVRCPLPAIARKTALARLRRLQRLRRFLEAFTCVSPRCPSRKFPDDAWRLVDLARKSWPTACICSLFSFPDTLRRGPVPACQGSVNVPSLRRLPAFRAALADIKATLCPRRPCTLPAHYPERPFQDAPPFVRCLKMSTHVACTDAHINLHLGTPCPSARKGWGNAGVDLGSAPLERSRMADLRATSQQPLRYLNTRREVSEARCVAPTARLHQTSCLSQPWTLPPPSPPTSLSMLHIASQSLLYTHGAPCTYCAYLNRIHIAAIQNSTIQPRTLLEPPTC